MSLYSDPPNPQERVLNLRKYMAQVRLPPLDEDYECDTARFIPGDDGPRQQPSLQFHRRLETVQCLDGLIRGSLESWLHDAIPEEDIWAMEPCSETNEFLAIPVPLPDKCRTAPKTRPTQALLIWMNSLPLFTAQRVLHLTLPETKCWDFGSPAAQHVDLHPLATHEYLWAPKPQPGQSLLLSQESSKKNGVLVVIQPPWLLTSPVLFDFVHTHTLPGFITVNPLGIRAASAYQDHHRLWAKVYDSCVLHQTRFFVLSSYRHWVFGAFAPGYTTAYVSGVYSSTQNDPSIMELLTFWIASSMGLSGAFVTPEATERYYSSPAAVYQPCLAGACPLDGTSFNASESHGLPGGEGVENCCQSRVKAAPALTEQRLVDMIRTGNSAAPQPSVERVSLPTQKAPSVSLPFLSTIDSNPCNINGNFWVGHWLTVLYG